jgi:hypothetical protein
VLARSYHLIQYQDLETDREVAEDIRIIDETNRATDLLRQQAVLMPSVELRECHQISAELVVESVVNESLTCTSKQHHEPVHRYCSNCDDQPLAYDGVDHRPMLGEQHYLKINSINQDV